MSTTEIGSTTLQVRKRSGKVVDYRRQKITQAVMLCLVNSCGREINDDTKKLAEQVTNRVERIVKHAGGTLNVEGLQDLVEDALMALGEHDAAKQYILYRDAHRKLREAAAVDAKTEKAIQEDRKYFGSDAQLFQHYDKYARFNEIAGRRETFVETVDRQIAYLRREVESRHGLVGVVTEQEWGKMRRFILEAKATPSMRLMQTAGAAAWRENMGCFNCAASAVDDIDRFDEALYISMQGTGYAFSVESQFVEQLPQVKVQRQGYTPEKHVVADSTEGWCTSTRALIHALFDGYDLDIDYSLLRPAGARLKTKGGTSSGKIPLVELHQACRRIIKARQNRRLRDIDCHDIMCFVGRAGEMGGFRRAAMLSHSDFESLEMRSAKASYTDGAGYWTDPKRIHRAMANNTAVYLDKPEPLTFLDEWVQLAKSRSGERGIFNRGSLPLQLPLRRRQLYGENIPSLLTNPCGETHLHPTGGLCNLSIAICRPDDTAQSLFEKVEVAAIFGTLQSMLTNFQYIRYDWKINADRERLLGVDLLGALDCPLLRASNSDRDSLLRQLRDKVVQTNLEWATRLGINQSVATTVIKPGGNSGFRWGTGQSMSGWLSAYMIRNVEVPKHSPMYPFLREQGVPFEDSYRDPNTAIFSFPLEAPAGAMVVADLQIDSGGNITSVKPRRTAIDQLEDWLAFKVNWTEQNPSVSIYVADHEWLEVGNWVYSHWDQVGGLSFFPLDNGVYVQAPFTPVTESKFRDFVSKFPAIQWEKLPRYDGGHDKTEGHREKACTGKEACGF